MEITNKQFKKFAEQISEPEWFTKYRLNSFLNSQKTDYPSFRYGLSINIKPSDFNFSEGVRLEVKGKLKFQES